MATRAQIPDFAQTVLDWRPHDAQIKWLRARPRYDNELITGRRWGKTEVEALETLHTALFVDASRQCLASVTVDQARLAYDVFLRWCFETGLSDLFEKGYPKETPFPTVKFRAPLSSLITVRSTARNGLYIRGHKFTHFRLDEADYVEEKIIQEAVRMTLADVGGPLFYYTTPAQRRGLVYRNMVRFKLGDTKQLYVQEGASYENPHIQRAFIDAQRGHMTEAQYSREVLGIYADDTGNPFKFADIQAAYQDVEYNGAIPQPYDASHSYVAGWDLAKDVDWTVGIVHDVTTRPFRQVAFYRWQREPWTVTAARMADVHNAYHCQQSYYDATGVGAVISDLIQNANIMPIIFTGARKADMLQNAQLILEQRGCKFPFVKQQVDEMQAYEWDDKNLVTDCVMAWALSLYAASPVMASGFAPNPWP